MPEPPPSPLDRTYWCFLSYRHADNKAEGRQWATWLQHALETYQVPPELVGQQNRRGESIPAYIYPVFRDEEELPADADLQLNIIRALEQSRFLVVICSPQAVESVYVADEIRRFKAMGKSTQVIAAIISGEPNASVDHDKTRLGMRECFPEPIRVDVNQDGQLTKVRTEPIAADFRIEETGEEGWTNPEAYREDLERQGLKKRVIEARLQSHARRMELMKLKIIAGVIGIALGDLTHRDKAYQLSLARRRARTLRHWLTAVGILGIVALLAGWLALIRGNEAVKQKDAAEAARLSERRSLALSYHDQALGMITEKRLNEAAAYVARAQALDPENPLYRSMAFSLLFEKSNQLPGRPPSDFGRWAEATVSRDGRFAAIHTETGELMVVNLETGVKTPVDIPQLTPPVVGLSFADDGSLVVSTFFQVLRWHGGQAPSVSFYLSAPDLLGQAIATKGGKATVSLPREKIRNMLQGFSGNYPVGTLQRCALDREPQSINLHKAEVVGIHPWKDERMASVGKDRLFAVWDALTGDVLRRITLPATPEKTVFHAESGLLVVGTEGGRVFLCHCEGNDKPLELGSSSNQSLESLAVSDDGKFVAVARWSGEAKIRVWNTATLRVASVEMNSDEGVKAMAFSHSGDMLAILGEERQAMLVTREGQILRKWDTAGEGNEVVFTPDDSTVVTATKESRFDYQSATIAPQTIQKIVPGFPMKSIEASRDGKWLLATSPDEDWQTQLFDSNTGEPASAKIRSQDAGAKIVANLAPSGENGKPRIVTSSNYLAVEVWDSDGKRLAQLPSLPTMADLIVKVEEQKLGITEMSMPGAEGIALHDDVLMRAIPSMDLSKMLAALAANSDAEGNPSQDAFRKLTMEMRNGTGGYLRGKVAIHGLPQLEILSQIESNQSLLAPTLSEDGKTFLGISGSLARPMIWHLRNSTWVQQEIPSSFEGAGVSIVNGYHLTPDGKYLVMLAAPPAVLDLAAPSPQWRTMNTGRRPTRVTKCPDSRRVAFDFRTNHYESLLQMWDLESCQPSTPLMKHDSRITGLSFSSDGAWLLTWTNNGEALLWDTHLGRLAALPWKTPDTIVSACFTGDGRIAYATRDEIHLAPLPDSSACGWCASALEAAANLRISPAGNLEPSMADLRTVLSGQPSASPRWTELAERLQHGPGGRIPGFTVEEGEVLARNAEAAWIKKEHDQARLLAAAAREAGYTRPFRGRLQKLESMLRFAGADKMEKATSPHQRPSGTIAEGPNGIRFRWCPPGRFQMGSGPGISHRFSNEQAHEVILTRGFWMSETEITQAQWLAVMGEHPRVRAVANLTDETKFPSTASGGTITKLGWHGLAKPEDVDSLGFFSPEFPMIFAKWDDACNFARTVETNQTFELGGACRLPTEAEWEYACRAGTTGETWIGDPPILGISNSPVLGTIAWYSGNASEGFSGTGWDCSQWKELQVPGKRAGIHPVAQKAANPWGFYDMLGNVWEWCSDAGGQINVHMHVDPLARGTNPGLRVARGGSFFSTALGTKTVAREEKHPEWAGADFGFRIVVVPPEDAD